jgi:NAD(P)-dependent dehydrogenase (short-subunit alcohol dehydrogenase family)
MLAVAGVARRFFGSEACMRFQGKSAIVTGASEGIGFAIARALVANGAHVVLIARRELPLQKAAEWLGPLALYVVGDVADPAIADRAVAAARERHGGLDLLVNNAGLLVPGGVAQQPLEEVDRMLALNLRAPIAWVRAAVPALTGRPGAAILNLGSATGRVPSPGLAAYGATKAALQYLTETWARELAPAGIRVNCLSPGATETPALTQAMQTVPGLRERAVTTNLIKRLASADEIANAALFLLDEHQAGYATGAIWDLDGGYHKG